MDLIYLILERFQLLTKISSGSIRVPGPKAYLISSGHVYMDHQVLEIALSRSSSVGKGAGILWMRGGWACGPILSYGMASRSLIL